MLLVVPAWNAPTVSTTGSKALTRRVTSVCSAAHHRGGRRDRVSAPCGAEPWPPRAADRHTQRVGRRHQRARPGDEPRAGGSAATSRAAVAPRATRRPGARRARPRRSSTAAPSKPSSPGWNMNTTSPGELVAVRGQQPGRPSEHRDVQVVTAGVHRAVDLGGEREPRLLAAPAARPCRRAGAPPARAGPPRSTAVTELSASPGAISSGRPVERLEDGLLGAGKVQSELGTAVQRAAQLRQLALHRVRVLAQCR